MAKKLDKESKLIFQDIISDIENLTSKIRS